VSTCETATDEQGNHKSREAALVSGVLGDCLTCREPYPQLNQVEILLNPDKGGRGQ
jgi:hypothetical protein